jgi:hypothetical protein
MAYYTIRSYHVFDQVRTGEPPPSFENKNRTYLVREIRRIWHDVEAVFPSADSIDLYDDLSKANFFRNTRVAHIEKIVDNPDEAWNAMVVWFRRLNQMIRIAE